MASWTVVAVLLLSTLIVVSSNNRWFRAGKLVYGNGELLVKYDRGCGNVTLPAAQWFKQKLDHFRSSDDRTWEQRYYTNTEYFLNRTDSPVFVMIGGEGAITPKWMVEGHWIELAQKQGALCLQLEHRYYGESKPTSNLSVKNLAFLSSEQALADLAVFIQSKKDEYGLSHTNRVIVFGGSYPGSLAAWFRLKYPHLAHGAVASSAPLKAQLDFKEYFEVVTDSLNSFSAGCSAIVQNATENINQLLQEGETGWKNIQETFRLCGQFNGSIPEDVSTLMESLASNFAGVVQYNGDNREFEGAKATNITIDVVCGILQNSDKGSALQRLADVNSVLMDAYNTSCLNFTYQSTVRGLQDTTWEGGSANGRQWTYQTCTEFGFFQTSDSSEQPFGSAFPYKYFAQLCRDVYGTRYGEHLQQRGVQWSNTNYGKRGIRVTRVIFPNGSVDPWHKLGILKDLSAHTKAVFITGTAHCADMYPASPSDPPQLIAARQTIDKIVQRWIRNE